MKGVIEEYEISGIHHRADKLPKVDYRNFVGYVTTEYNPYDDYAISVYDEAYGLIGYLPKGNRKLHTTIKQKHGGKAFSWGLVKFNNPYWNGSISIAADIDNSRLAILKQELPTLIEKKNNGTLPIHTFYNEIEKLLQQ